METDQPLDLNYTQYDDPLLYPESDKEKEAGQEQEQSNSQSPTSKETPTQTEQKSEDQAEESETDEFTPQDALAAVPLGVVDTAADIAGLIGFKKADDWWDNNSPRNDNPWIQGIRQFAGVVVPSMILGGKFKAVGRRLPGAANLGKRTKFVGETMAELGADATIAAMASSANMDASENVGNFAEKIFGINVPWAIRDADSPDVRWAKNMADNTSIGGFASLLGGVWKFRKAATLVKPGTDEVVETAAQKASAKLATGDEIVDGMAESAGTKRANEIQEGVENLKKDPTGQDSYNPYTNNIAEDTARPASSQPVDPTMNKVDNFRMVNNLGTTNGAAAPVMSKGLMNFLSSEPDPVKVGKELKGIIDAQSTKVDLVYNGKRFKAEEIDLTLDQAFEKVLNYEASQFQAMFNNLVKWDTIQGQKTLNAQGLQVANKLMKRAIAAVDPNNARATAAGVQQAGTQVASSSKAIGVIGEFADTTSQQMNVWDNLKYLSTETNYYRKISSENFRANNMLLNGKGAEGAKEFAENIKNARQAAIESAETSTNTYKRLAKENPEFFKPFYEVLESTGGEADTLYKMQQYMKNRVGLVSKAFYDGEPTVPSYLVQALQSIRYGNILMVRAPIAAATGNTILLGLKPITRFAGSLVEGNTKEVLWTFGGVQENWMRGLQAFRNEWRTVTSSPLAAAKRQRKDIASVNKQLNDFEALEQYYQSKWDKKEDLGQIAAWNMTKVLTYFANTNVMRFGANAMTALDAFTRSFIASGEARSRAYQKLYKQMGTMTPEQFKQAFKDEQRKIYSSMFDASDMLVDEAALQTSKEITFQQDSKVVDSIEGMLKNWPAAKALFMFPRTGVNALNMAWSYAPSSKFMKGIGLSNKTINAKTTDQIDEVLRMHGYNPNSQDIDKLNVFKNLKSEYIGREMAGSAVIMGAGIWAMNGNLTGSGPRDIALKKRMEKYQGWQEYSFRSPIDGKWISYKGLEPFTSVMGLTADLVFELTRMDQNIGEDFLRKLMYSITSNVSNKTFLSGFEPLVGFLSGDEGTINRFIAREIDSMIPGTSARGVLNDIIAPQMNDFKNDVGSYLANRNAFLQRSDGDLAPEIDPFNGEQIKQWDFFNRAWNGISPLFKTGSDPSPQKEYLASIGYEGLSRPYSNRVSQTQITPAQRQWLNEWVGKNRPLNQIVDDIRFKFDKSEFHKNEILKTATIRRREGREKSEMDIGNTLLHEELDRRIQEAFNEGWNAMQEENYEMYRAGELRSAAKNRINQGRPNDAARFLDDADKTGY